MEMRRKITFRVEGDNIVEFYISPPEDSAVIGYWKVNSGLTFYSDYCANLFLSSEKVELAKAAMNFYIIHLQKKNLG